MGDIFAFDLHREICYLLGQAVDLIEVCRDCLVGTALDLCEIAAAGVECVHECVGVEFQLLTKVQRTRILRKRLKAIEKIREAVEQPASIGVIEDVFDVLQTLSERFGSRLCGGFLPQTSLYKVISDGLDANDIDASPDA